MNIKNPRVIELAKRCAEVTGGSQVSVLEAALEAYLAQALRARDDAQLRQDELLRAIREEAATLDDVTTDDLYDDFGLPA